MLVLKSIVCKDTPVVQCLRECLHHMNDVLRRIHLIVIKLNISVELFVRVHMIEGFNSSFSSLFKWFLLHPILLIAAK